MTDFRQEALQLVLDNGYRDLCEIGVWQGDLARLLYPHTRTLVLVDPWSALWNNFNHLGKPYTCTMGLPLLSQADLNLMYERVCNEFPGALVLRMPSIYAALNVPAKSLDFVYIDAVHTHEHCRLDILTWLPKIRKGGMIAGDDYIKGEPFVAKAVDEVFGVKPRGDRTWWERV